MSVCHITCRLYDVTRNDPLIGRVHVLASARERQCAANALEDSCRTAREFEVVAFQGRRRRLARAGGDEIGARDDDTRRDFRMGFTFRSRGERAKRERHRGVISDGTFYRERNAFTGP